MDKETIIISLGGSLIIPEEIDKDFLVAFRSLIVSHVEQGKQFIIITGGGKICRKYQQVAKEISSPADAELDLIGIKALNLNAELMRVIFGNFASPTIVYDREEKLSFDKPIVICGAERPGSSTDLGAVVLAKNVGSKKVINLSNTDYVYDKDPKTNPDAKKIEKISWAEYRALIPAEWNPGLNSPFDPIASKLAEEQGITVMTMNGKPIDNLVNALDGKDFLGTTIF